mgnify:CR=1 FL=1
MILEQTILEEREFAKAEGKAETLKNLVKKGLISISVAAKEAGMIEEA